MTELLFASCGCEEAEKGGLRREGWAKNGPGGELQSKAHTVPERGTELQADLGC